MARPLSPETIMWLAGHLGGARGVQIQQFAEMMEHIKCAQAIFRQIDRDHSGNITVPELSRALHLSGLSIPINREVAQQMIKNYDDNNNAVLEFDEFLQLRFEWDTYLTSWERHV